MLDAGVGVIQMYVVRTAVCSLIFVILVPRRDIPLAELPRLTFRGAFTSAYFMLLIVAVQWANPAVVQAAAATTPLFLLLLERLARGRSPSLRLMVAACLASVGMVAMTVA